MLSIYKFDFLKGKGSTPNGVVPHEDFVRTKFCNLPAFKVPLLPHNLMLDLALPSLAHTSLHTTAQILREQTFVMTSKQYDRKLVQTSLAMRYPVYFGIPALVDFGLYEPENIFI